MSGPLLNAAASALALAAVAAVAYLFGDSIIPKNNNLKTNQGVVGNVPPVGPTNAPPKNEIPPGSKPQETEAKPANELQVKTTLGMIEGCYTTTRGGRRVLQFLGIPYAKPPVKELSFRDPVAPDPWKDVRKATEECSICLQQFVLVEELRNTVIGEEDCLCINIFTPKAGESSKFPVIFFIHGGAYLGLSSTKSFYGPQMLLDKDVVLVTFNYRLGVLGFLSTEDNVIPGNWAMKDQAMALRWVKANIDKFGGDPNSITLMGEDTGAGSVHLHMLSPLTKDLFHRGIIESGSGLCLWGFSQPGVLKKRSKKVADIIGCPFEPSKTFLECLQKTDSKKIVDTTKDFLVYEQDPYAFWNPAIEMADVKGAFLVENPYLLTSDKPLLAGFNAAEGMMQLSAMIAGTEEKRMGKNEVWKREFDKIAPVSLLYETKVRDPEGVTRAVRQFYLDAYLSMWMTQKLNTMYGDFWFTNGLLDAVEKHKGPKYLYHFAYDSSVSVCYNIYNPKLQGFKLYHGACHMDELLYLFPMGIKENIFNDTKTPEYKMSLKMVELWTNFAKNSVPTANEITWEPVKTAALEYLDITNKKVVMKKDPIPDRRKFWKALDIIIPEHMKEKEYKTYHAPSLQSLT